MRIINKLICLIKGHKNAMPNLRVHTFTIIGTSGLPIVEIKICSRCHVMYWNVPDNIPKKFHNNIEKYDKIAREEFVKGMSRVIPTIGNA